MLTRAKTDENGVVVGKPSAVSASPSPSPEHKGEGGEGEEGGDDEDEGSGEGSSPSWPRMLDLEYLIHRNRTADRPVTLNVGGTKFTVSFPNCCRRSYCRVPVYQRTLR